MWLLVGLGNPGDRYSQNRHNVGFMVLDEIAHDYVCSSFKVKHQALVSEGKIGDHKVLLMKPQTFMNESGRAIKEAVNFFKIAPDRIVVFHDELDLNPAKIRVKFDGGLAGHNGLKSTKAHLGTAAFWRVRLGIGHPGDKNRVSGYVLRNFNKEEWPDIEDMVRAVSRHIELLLDGADEDFMTKVAL